MRRLIASAVLLAALGGGGWAMAQEGAREEPRSQARALVVAKQEAEQARRRSELLERQADRATGEAARARAEAAALAARIQSAEAEITAAETRIRLIEQLRREQRARLAEKQAPLIRLTAALQIMARRPPALALVQPGSVDEIVHVRSLLASALPIIRQRTAALRAEVERGNRLRRQAETAFAALTAGREDLKRRRVALARFEQDRRARSETLMGSAMVESDRALALGEEARDLAALAGTRAFQDQLRRSLAALPGPALRPGTVAGGQPPAAGPVYLLPVAGRLVTGMGEISDAGVTPAASPSRPPPMPMSSRRPRAASLSPAASAAMARSSSSTTATAGARPSRGWRRSG
jgi:septal ring factor EnvC (AmiA/AmiB activator)